MAHFAEIDGRSIVLRVIVLNDDYIRDADGRHNELLGKNFLEKNIGGEWVQTSYSASFRKRFAGIGYTYDKHRDAFISPRPYLSWLLNDDTCNWEPPIEMPEDGNRYRWNEIEMDWELAE
nr:hypothetical protein [uncultured Mediterranean phage uvMED]